jgi:hypothetical protein
MASFWVAVVSRAKVSDTRANTPRFSLASARTADFWKSSAWLIWHPCRQFMGISAMPADVQQPRFDRAFLEVQREYSP